LHLFPWVTFWDMRCHCQSLPDLQLPYNILSYCLGFAPLQDYTLVAVAAVAAHLMKAGLGEDYGLRKLAERHGHDAAALDQVRCLS
jgi:hypothetical protein